MAMAGWWVGLALAIPWLAGALWVRALWRDAPAGVWSLALGYGYILGLLSVTLLLRVQAAVGWPLDFTAPLAVMMLLALAGGWRTWRRRGANAGQPLNGDWRGQPLWQWLLFAVLLGWLGWRFATLAQEVWLRPLYPWDAWTTWAVRPRVWAELRELTPFVAPISG